MRNKKDVPAPTDEQNEASRLKRKAQSLRLSSKSKAANVVREAPPSSFKKLDGCDLIKKHEIRKTKYLFLFPGEATFTGSGEIGRVEHLDTTNPILYVDHPEGTLKMRGTLFYPKTKLLTLTHNKGHRTITTSDCLEHIIVFSECVWIGKKEDNPDENELEMPSSFREITSDSLKPIPRTQIGIADTIGCDEESEEPSDGMEVDSTTATPMERTRQSSRSSVSQGRPKYRDNTDDEDEGADSDGASEAEKATADKPSWDFLMKSVPASKTKTPTKSTTDDSLPLKENQPAAAKRRKTDVEEEEKAKENSDTANGHQAVKSEVYVIDSDEEVKMSRKATSKSKPAPAETKSRNSTPRSNRKEKAKEKEKDRENKTASANQSQDEATQKESEKSKTPSVKASRPSQPVSLFDDDPFGFDEALAQMEASGPSSSSARETEPIKSSRSSLSPERSTKPTKLFSIFGAKK